MTKTASPWKTAIGAAHEYRRAVDRAQQARRRLAAAVAADDGCEADVAAETGLSVQAVRRLRAEHARGAAYTVTVAASYPGREAR